MIRSNISSVYGCDRLGREIPYSADRRDRLVGIFYFVWHDQSGHDGPYDVSKIIAEDPTAARDMDHPAWGPLNGAMHHWGEPLYGYYFSEDEWIIRRHIEMLSYADIDFIVFDTTNRVIYFDKVTKIMSIISEYLSAGYNVPKVVFYTNTDSGGTVNELYDRIYSKGLYRDSWFIMDGKPLIIDKPDECREEARDFFTHRISQWPFDPVHKGGFPWMEFIRPQRVYRDGNGAPEIMNVSVAQHPNCAHSDSAFFGEEGAWGRSFHDGAKDIRENSYEYGFNFAEQWEYALKKDPKMVFVTGWNEWTAGRWTFDRKQPTSFTLTNDEGSYTYSRDGIPETRGVMCDACSLEYSRDIEPMKGGYFDSYYMQLIEYVRRFKGGYGDCEDDGSGVEYSNFSLGNVGRSCRGYGHNFYSAEKSANNIVGMTVRSDKDNIIFTCSYEDDIVTEGKYSRLYIVPLSQDTYGSVMSPYRTATYIVRPDGVISRYLNKAETGIGHAETSLSGRTISYTVPRDLIGMPSGSPSALDFKWADGIAGDNTVEDFYLNGCVAPYGRLCCRYITKE
ncbi:MAG: hypothetical protein K6D94_10975 [Clostridiales bacterium]|nr:hypothetical protein [Clostridiales bacterium]